MRKMRKFSLERLKAEIREEDVIFRAKQCRPLRANDRQSRETMKLNGKAFWKSVCFRANGEIEIWLQPYRDDEISDWENHTGWEIVSQIRPVEPEEK